VYVGATASAVALNNDIADLYAAKSQWLAGPVISTCKSSH
jgi:hypothetical protein